MQNPYQVLGLPEDASPTDIENTYNALRQRLAPDAFTGKAQAQARKCIAAIDEAYNVMKDTDKLTQYKEKKPANLSYETTHPRLGQLCVASGIISMEQLDEAVHVQLESGMPLGEVLEDMQFLSRAELEGLLLGQDLIDVDGERNDPLAQRLIALNLATVDMVQIAQMEMKWQEISLTEVFVRHGWLDEQISKALFAGQASNLND